MVDAPAHTPMHTQVSPTTLHRQKRLWACDKTVGKDRFSAISPRAARAERQPEQPRQLRSVCEGHGRGNEALPGEIDVHLHAGCRPLLQQSTLCKRK